MTQSQRAIIAGPLGVLGRSGQQDPKIYSQELDNLVLQNPGNKDIENLAGAYKTSLSMIPLGGHVADGAIKLSQSLMSPTEQQASLSPTASLQNTGGELTPMVSTPSVGGNAPTIAPSGAAGIPITLPPTTPVMGGPNGATPGYLGQPAGAPPSLPPSLGNIPPNWQKGADGDRLQILQNELSTTTNLSDRAALQREIQRTQLAVGMSAPQQPAAKPGFVASGLPAGAAQGIVGTQDQINKHWTETQTSAGTAQQDIGVLQNIKQHAAGAATGVAADNQTLVAGIAGMLGMDKGELAKTNADLLAKNSNMLALAGGDTNLARTMAEAATPNSHMTKEAIIQAADQVIGQRRLSLARAQFLTPFKAMADQGHPEMYNNALNQFNSVADPKVIQFDSMSAPEAKAMIGSMSTQDRVEFRAKLSKAISLGIAK